MNEFWQRAWSSNRVLGPTLRPAQANAGRMIFTLRATVRTESRGKRATYHSLSGWEAPL